MVLHLSMLDRTTTKAFIQLHCLVGSHTLLVLAYEGRAAHNTHKLSHHTRLGNTYTPFMCAPTQARPGYFCSHAPYALHRVSLVAHEVVLVVVFHLSVGAAKVGATAQAVQQQGGHRSMTSHSAILISHLVAWFPLANIDSKNYS